MSDILSVGTCATLACLLEVNAPKVGNVNRSADFADMSFGDFLVSAAAIGPVFDRADQVGTCQLIRDAVVATRNVCHTNTNLGIILLLSPLARIPSQISLQTGIQQILQDTASENSRPAFDAIVMASPGGMGQVEQSDVHDAPDIDLIAAMQLARARDRIARQYCENFTDVFDRVVPALLESLEKGYSLPDAIVFAHVKLISEIGDSLIARKCGHVVEEVAQQLATEAIRHPMHSESYLAALSEMDFWMRSDGNRRNPGTTADLITAGLFVALRDGSISMPLGFQ